MFKTQTLYQNDERWKNTKLGNSRETIGGWGCLLTSATMMLNGMGYDETPETVNEKMKKAGGFQGALFIPSVLPYIWPNCAYRDMQPCESYPAPIAEINAAVAAGKPVILQVDWNKQAGIQTHFVLIKDVKGGDYVLYDPYKYAGDSPEKEVLLTERYRFNGAKLESEISAVLWFDTLQTATRPPEIAKVPVPADALHVFVAEDDLALRSEPSTNGYLWRRLMKGSELTSLESGAAAKSKLGTNGQWLHVQDPNGNQGYVAAWYVTESMTTPAVPASGTGASAPAGPVPAGAIALFPTEDLAMRSKPVISQDNLIRRIPPTEQLTCLEPPNQAISKVGVNGQWLKVRDAAGTDGYVAAWYVRYPSSSSSKATAPAPVNGGALKVRATAEGVALRKQPVISDATLIKRLSLGTVLTVTEPNGEAKIGRNDQWLQVKDPAGTEGVVAAWFVAR